MAFSGDLSDIALPDILQLVATQGKSGTLTLCRDEETVRISIVDGMAVDASTSSRPLYRRVGAMLINAGLLTREELKRAVTLQREGGRKLGQVLVQERMVEADDVRSALSLQRQQLLFDVLRWEIGSYDFQRCEVDYDQDNLEPENMSGVLMRGMQILDEWPTIEKRFVNRHLILHAVPNPDLGEGDSEPELSRQEEAVFARIDGHSTIQQVIDRSMLLEFEACRAIFDLWERNLIGPGYDGQLAEVGVPELLLAIRRTRGTGQLTLEAGPTAAILTFRDGDLQAAVSSDPDHSIGTHLLRCGVMSRHDLSVVVADAGGSEGVADYLVSSGAMEAERVNGHLCEQMANLVVATLRWTDGSYRYRPGAPTEIPDVGLRSRTPGLILQGIRAIDSWSKVERAVGAGTTAYSYSDELRQAAVGSVWPAEHVEQLQLFTGGLSVDDACERAEVPDFLMHQLIWWGRVMGLLEGGELSAGARLLVAALSGEAPDAATPSERRETGDELDFDEPREVVEPVAAAPAAGSDPASSGATRAQATDDGSEDETGEVDLAAVAAAATASMMSAAGFYDDPASSVDVDLDGTDLLFADLQPDDPTSESSPVPPVQPDPERAPDPRVEADAPSEVAPEPAGVSG